MFNKLTTKARRALSVLRFGLLVLQYCGLRYSLKKLAHQLYGSTIFLVGDISLDAQTPKSPFKCTVSRATPGEVDEIFRAIPFESREGRYQLLVRKWYHNRGFGDCYVARATETGEICHIRWLVTPEHIKQLGWEDRFPLEEDQLMRENSYTFEKYRRKGVKSACLPQLDEITKNLGFTRAKRYVEETNIPQLAADMKAGNLAYARVEERHFMFRVKRRTIECYDPPIPITVPQKKQP